MPNYNILLASCGECGKSTFTQLLLKSKFTYQGERRGTVVEFNRKIRNEMYTFTITETDELPDSPYKDLPDAIWLMYNAHNTEQYDTVVEYALNYRARSLIGYAPPMVVIAFVNLSCPLPSNQFTKDNILATCNYEPYYEDLLLDVIRSKMEFDATTTTDNESSGSSSSNTM